MKKMLVKIFAVILFSAVCMSSFVGCAARDKTLRIYNWGEYMDETVVDSFKEWYKGEFGEDIKVVYKEFDSNETLNNAIARKGEDWDLACPSDYMIDRFIQNDLLLPIGESVDRSVINENLIDMMTFDAGLQYSIPYIWGTFGIMYDSEYVKNTAGLSEDDMKSWSVLWSNDYKGKIFMKEQVRDSYTVAMLHERKDDLLAAASGVEGYSAKAYQDLLKEIFTEYDDDTLALAEAQLKKQKPNLYKYETDDGKMDMATGNTPAKLGLFWSCDAGFVMNDYESEAVGCAKAISQEGNKNLRYVVPEEGSNVWVDGWVIPKTSKNPKAAELFLQYLLRDDISKLNAQYAGAPTANAQAMQELEDEIREDDEFFDSAKYPQEFKDMYLEMMFPSDETLKRCYVMGDFGPMLDKMSEMFQRVLISSN